MRCAEDVLSAEELQPACGFVGCWPGHKHAGTPPPPTNRAYSWLARPSSVCARAGVVQEMFEHAVRFNQPVATWNVGQVIHIKVCHQHHASRLGGPAHTAPLRGHRGRACVHCGFATPRVRVCAQGMFHCAGSRQQAESAFNQPLAAWDVGRIRDMEVCHHPVSGSGARAHTQPLRGAATSHMCVLARRSKCSPGRPFSTSLWQHGMLARSLTSRCAAALCGGVGGLRARTAAQGSGHKPCACAGAAQRMFKAASSFNQPLAAWDVGQVTNMQVRRRPASWSQSSSAHSC